MITVNGQPLQHFVAPRYPGKPATPHTVDLVPVRLQVLALLAERGPLTVLQISTALGRGDNWLTVSAGLYGTLQGMQRRGLITGTRRPRLGQGRPWETVWAVAERAA